MKNIIFGLGILMLLTACNSKEQSAPAKQEAPPPTQVTTLAVTSRDVPVNFEYVGQVAGSQEVEIRARVTGIIEERLFEEGKTVNAGQTLFKIDPKPFNAQLGQAQAALAIAKASKEGAIAQLKISRRDFARIAPLAKKKLLSRQDKDNAESSIELAKAAMHQADAAILQAKAEINTSQINLDYTTIKAPISGIIGRALKTKGGLVEAGSNSLLTSIAQIDPAYINFGVAESEQIQHDKDLSTGKLLLPASGFKVALKNTVGNVLEKTGSVNFKDYKIDSSTGNFAMRASIDNAEKTLSPGQFVRVILQGGIRPSANVIPQRAVLDSPQGKYVYLAEKNEKGGFIAQRQAIEVGEWVQLDGELKNAWIIKSGLKNGDEVVINGMARIFFPGMPIQPSSGMEQKVAGQKEADNKVTEKVSSTDDSLNNKKSSH